jgi:hypothetical protein
MEDAGLTYQRQGGRKTRLVAVGANEFWFSDDPLIRVRFLISGDKATALELIRDDGSKVQAQRTQ